MLRFLIKRLGYAAIVLFCVSIVSFALIHIAPGNPARMMLADGASEAQVKAMEVQMGLDKPLVTQYFKYLGGVLHGDLGTSVAFKVPCSQLIFGRLPATIKLTLATVFVSLLISIPLGIIAGIKRGTIIDLGAMLFALLGQSMSTVWLGMLLILIFAVNLGWFPALGYGHFNNIVLPAITLGFPLAALVTRMLRSGMIDVLKEDFITATFAKGMSRKIVHFKYALKNAMIPVVTIVGMQIGYYLGGAIVTEQIFGWPGIGSLTVQAISLRDYPLVQSILLVISTMFVFINILVDVINTLVDPRMSLN
jgi:ABC-type dipeptide/oligopeptide/nickel transport systems, permease components